MLKQVLLLTFVVAAASVVTNVVPDSTFVLHERNPFRDKEVYVSKAQQTSVIVHRPVPPPRSATDFLTRLNENKERKYQTLKQERVIGSLPDDYWRFIPEYIGSVIPGGDSIQWSSPCFKQHSAKAEKTSKGYKIVFDTHEKSDWLCDDGYLIATVESFHIEYFELEGQWTLEWTGNLPNASLVDIESMGFRIFRFSDGVSATIVDVWETLQLFLGALLNKDVPEWTEEDNVKFLKDYMNVTFEERTQRIVTLPESAIQSGDFFGVLRMDGLDPMLAWGMGSHTGHTTIALRIDGQLNVCESTVDSVYWPTNGVQCTPWNTWLKQAEAASYNVVHLPLSPHFASVFNATAALEFFKSTKGLPYGFHNLLFGWIDTPEDNYPPPLTSHLAMVLFGVVEDLININETIDIWSQGLNKRLGTNGLSTRECYAEAHKRGISFTELVTMPELDKWMYKSPDNVYGPAMVCDVFVMRMWKAGGIFGDITDEIQAGEFTNWDAYNLNIFDTNYKRPSQCVDADPDSQFCQLMGKFRLTLPGYNLATPFPHMRERCPSLAPLYKKPANC